MGKIRRGGYVFITWKGDHSPRHVHVYRDSELVVKWDLENGKDDGRSTDTSDPEIDRQVGAGRPVMKIRRVTANNRRKAFEVEVRNEVLLFPYARLRLKPSAGKRVAEVYADPELGREAFTYVLENGDEDSVHLDEVLEYNQDPDYLRNLLLYKLTLEAQDRIGGSDLSKREIVRRLGTSASQLYRLLDQTNYSKSVGQLLALLHVLDCDVDLVVRKRSRKTA